MSDISYRTQILELEEQKWAEEKELIKRENKIKEERRAAKKGNRMSTSKMLILFLFINCTLLELFTGFVVFKSLDISATFGIPADFSPLIALIGAIVGEVIGYAIYALKSAKENSVGGIVYETAMKNNN